jgi:predicted  nucleic acid-binding Zn-ribbon protein
LAQDPLQGPNDLHIVDNAEADQLNDFMKRAIPHNEMLNRHARNMYGRIQTIEKDILNLKEEIAELKQALRSGSP